MQRRYCFNVHDSGMVVINPSDDIEAKAAVKAAYEHVGPVYMRFGRLAVPVINDHPDYKFELGKGVVLKDGGDVAVIATGPVSMKLLRPQLCLRQMEFVQRSLISIQLNR